MSLIWAGEQRKSSRAIAPWLPPLLVVVAGLYLYILIRLFDSTIRRLLP